MFVELNNTPPQYAQVLAGDGIRPLQQAWGFRYWVFDVNAPSFAASGFQRYLDGGATLASGKTLPKLAVPALLIQDQKGGVFTCEPAPTSSRVVVDKVKALHAP
ncbi:hypothetical protein [Paludisphaera soli]|uniref:hypothetical protein n=1 Tax=Paludisphaera soli TaxID=2712865 RepID=UPI0013EBD047|nr:hypothetical protein [Paludisphaera soli]